MRPETPRRFGACHERRYACFLPSELVASSYYDFETSGLYIIELGKEMSYRLVLPGDAPTTCGAQRAICPGSLSSATWLSEVSSVDVFRPDNNLEVLYQDDYLLAVNKPAGTTVHAGRYP